MNVKDRVFGETRKWTATPLNRATVLVSVLVGLMMSVSHAVTTNAWQLKRQSLLAYREDDGLLVVNSKDIDARCPEILAWDFGAVVCGWGDEVGWGEIKPMELSSKEMEAIQSAFVWQKLRDWLWYPVQLALVLAVFILSSLCVRFGCVGVIATAQRIGKWISTGK